MPVMPSIATCTWPPITSVAIAAEPLYGTCVYVMLAMVRRCSNARCGKPPSPLVATVSLPGFALAHCTISPMLLNGAPGLATMPR
jgi:hypothetical protein